VYLQSEGVLRKRRISAWLEQQVQQAAGEAGIQALNGAALGAYTEIGPVWERGLEGVCLMVLRAGSSVFPEWHRLSDTPDRLQAESLGLAHDLAWRLLAGFDQDAGATTR
jgi:hypothetical protein